ncbi:DUF4124 domain-containing protein [Halomonas sp. Bachu 37]|uniref:DUF4124 domain-containing protein n=1 Tax=Halomonas kashgarensis TaxID=3084920 RepID=UPI003217603D
MNNKVLGALVGTLLWSSSVSQAFAQTVFRVVDEQGNVTFTDKPDRGGEALQLAPLPSALPGAAPAVDRDSSPRRKAAVGQPFMPYDRFAIASPAAGQILEAPLTSVSVEVVPALREDHQVRLLLDGEISQSALHSDVFWLAGLERGEHRLQAELLDSSGRVRHRSREITLSVR